MDLQSGTYYWPTTLPNAPVYPELREDAVCDVLVVGGGSSAAQCAYYLADTGLDVVLVEKDRIAGGSTRSNTAILQYSGEKSFTDLIFDFGEAYIRRHLKLLRAAIGDIEAACRTAGGDCGFARRDTLYSASKPEDVPALREEFEYLHREGCKVDFWERERIEGHYPFSREAAIYSMEDGELNPVRFTHALIAYAARKGVRVYEQTEVVDHSKQMAGDRVVLRTRNHLSIRARHVIYAAGYEGVEIRREKAVSFVSTYTITTKPVAAADLRSWHNRTLLWETARPYLYLRTTPDNRIIIGGLDEQTVRAVERDRLLGQKKEALVAALHKLFPAIPAEAEYALAGFYGGTKDGLPIIGRYEGYPGGYFLFGFNDNGLVYSQVLARLIVEELATGRSPDLALYLQDRPLRGQTERLEELTRMNVGMQAARADTAGTLQTARADTVGTLQAAAQPLDEAHPEPQLVR